MRSTDLIKEFLSCYHKARGGLCMVDAVTIGKAIQELRMSRGLSQEVLSGLANLDRTHYSKIERGLRSPTIDTIFKIANGLDMEPHEIMIAIEDAVNRKAE